ncbi:sigma 54-interacting transcriptional regulator [Clostridiaceae bacterium 35-E11]
MTLLKNIAQTVQQVAEAISYAIGIEVEIVDKELTVIGGTGLYAEKLGQKEEFGELEGNFLYARVLRTGQTAVVEEAQKDLLYDHLAVDGETKELAEICTPIKVGQKIIGIIGLVAFEKKQQIHLIQKQESMVSFVERMADLLAAKATQNQFLRQVEKTKNEMITILETIHEGMLAVNGQGYVTCCNAIAKNLLKRSRTEIIGKHLSIVMPNTLALEIMKTGKGYTEEEEIIKFENKSYRFIVTAKPIQEEEKTSGIVISFRDVAEAEKLAYNINQRKIKYTFDDIIGESDRITKVKNQALQVARGSSTVLITGESGTGKELFARAVHYASVRQNGPFISVNCGAIPDTLLESELFGYENGAFTGAKNKGKVGKFELADGGTIFLDEVGDLPLHLQVKLLHVLQNRCFERIGGNKTIFVDVRVIAATNKNLEEMIAQNHYREDLYYRLSVIPLKIPSLRERPEDIPLLMTHFLKKYNDFMEKDIEGFSERVKEIYRIYDWPGNVRELENAVEYGVNMTFTNEIQIEAVPPRVRKSDNNLDMNIPNISLQEQVKEFEKEILIKKIAKYGDSKDGKLAISKELNISRATLYRKLAEYRISRS